MVTQVAYGTLNTSASEQELLPVVGAPISANGIYILNFDWNPLVSGDVMQVRAKRKVISTGTEREVINEAIGFDQVQNNPMWPSIPLAAPYGMRFTLQQPSGATRAIKWSVHKIGEVQVVGAGTTTLGAGETAFSTFSINGGNGSLILDLTNMVDADSMLITAKAPAQDFDTERIAYSEFFAGVQPVPIWQSVPLIGSDFYATRQSSSSIIFDYSIESFL